MVLALWLLGLNALRTADKFCVKETKRSTVRAVPLKVPSDISDVVFTASAGPRCAENSAWLPGTRTKRTERSGLCGRLAARTFSGQFF